jgi:hypothetical protein
MKMFFNFLLHNVYGAIANRQYGDIHKEGETKKKHNGNKKKS